MNWAQIAHIFLEAAPTIANAISGPYGAIVGSIVSRAIGLSDSQPKNVLEALTNDPEAIDKLRLIEEQHSFWLKALTSMKWPTSINVNIKIDFAA